MERERERNGMISKLMLDKTETTVERFQLFYLDNAWKEWKPQWNIGASQLSLEFPTLETLTRMCSSYGREWKIKKSETKRRRLMQKLHKASQWLQCLQRALDNFLSAAP